MVDREVLRRFIALLIFNDEDMGVSDFVSIQKRIRRIFDSPVFMHRLSRTGVNWMNKPPPKVTSKILTFLDSLAH